MKGLLLALDTAGETLSYALHDGRELRVEHSWRAGRQATTQLAPAVARALAASGGAQALAALAVCAGPGSYTGLRSGIGLAQGLAEGRALPLVGIDAHAILAAGAHAIPAAGAQAMLAAGAGSDARRLWTTVAAGGGRYYARAFRWQEGQWRAAGDILRLTAAELRERRTADEAVIGDLSIGDLSIGDLTIGDLTSGELPAAQLRRAGWLAELAWRLLRPVERGRSAPDASRPRRSARSIPRQRPRHER